MAYKNTDQLFYSPKEHILRLVEWMSQGVYEKEQIIAIALLCSIAGENIFLLGPPGTAKSLVASRLKMVFKDAESFDYLMSRFSTPDEIFGPVSISRLKNEDRYERLTTGYLPEAHVVFLDEIWKAGPSIQNTLLSVINEHIFHNGGQIIRTPMKVLIGASNELPARDEGLEALWDRFLVRMVSNCIEKDSSFLKMLQSTDSKLPILEDGLLITEELYRHWQDESKLPGINPIVLNAIKSVRKSLKVLEKEDGNNLRYYISDRRWRKAYHLMQTSAYLNGREQIDLSDFTLLFHCLWNDVEAIPTILETLTSSMVFSTVKVLQSIDKSLNQLVQPRNGMSVDAKNSSKDLDNYDFREYDYFYYLVENYPDGDVYFSKWDYSAMTNKARNGIMYYDSKRDKKIIHTLVSGRPFEAKVQGSSQIKKLSVQKIPAGAIIDGIPYSFRRNFIHESSHVENKSLTSAQKLGTLRELFDNCVAEWDILISTNWTKCENIFLSNNDLAIVYKKVKEVNELIKTTEVKLNNVGMIFK